MGIVEYIRLRIYWVICLTLVVLSGLAVFIACQSPATGYEISIYTSTPIAVWVLIIINIATCVVLLVREASQENPSRRWLFPLSILMVNSIIVLLLSVFRDYYAIGSDTLMHMGFVSDMAAGTIFEYNIYPLVHMPLALLVRMGLSPSTATNLSPMVLYLIYVIAFYVLARIIWGDRREVIITTTLSAILLLPHGVGVSGTLIIASVFPLILVMILKLCQDFSVRYVVALLMFVIMVAFLHPITVEIAIISLVVACIAQKHNRIKLSIFTAILSVGVVVSYAIFFDITIMGLVMKDLASSISISSWIPPLSGVTKVSLCVVGDYGFLSLILRRYGCEMLLGFLAFVSLAIMMRWHRRGTYRNIWYVYFGSLFFVFNIMWVSEWYLQLDSYGFLLSRTRFLIPALSIILVTPMIIRLIKSQRFRQLSVIVVTVVLVLVSIGAIFNLYSSPLIGIANIHIPHQQIKGMTWLLEAGTLDMPIVHLNHQRGSRFVAAIKGATFAMTTYHNSRADEIDEGRLLKGFSYNENESIGSLHPQNFYLIVTKMDKVLPTWENEKLYLIPSDPATTLIYKDGDEYEIWFVKSKGEQ